MGTPEQLSSSKTQQVIPGERRQGRSARALTPENQSIVTWRESRATAGPASQPLLCGRCSQSKGLWAGVPGDRRRREAGARSGGGGVGAPREEGSCGQPRPMRRLFSKGVAHSGLAVSPSAPEQGRGGGVSERRELGKAVALPSALVALEPGWLLALARATPAGSPDSYVQPSRLLGAGDKGAQGTVRNPRGRTRDHDPGSGATVAPANAVCQRQSSPPCSPAGHRPRGAAGAGKARLQRPAHRLLPSKGAAPSRDATTRSRPEQKTRRLPLSQLRKEPRTGCRRVPSTLHTPLSPSGKSRALRKMRGRRERVALEIRLPA